MRCHKCGAPTEVLATRPYMGIFTRRTRECFNGHRTMSYEVPAGALDRRQLTAIQRGVRDREQAMHRKLTVIRSPGVPVAELAKKLNVTETRVRQIRKEVSQ